MRPKKKVYWQQEGKRGKMCSQRKEMREVEISSNHRLITITAWNGRWLAKGSDIREQQNEAENATAAPNLDYKKPFHFLISWKQWTGTTVSCTALPALGLMTEKNLKSPDCRVNFLPWPKVGTECGVCFLFAVMDASAPSAVGGRHYVRWA